MVIVAGLLANFGLNFRLVALQTIPLTLVSTINATNPMITLVLTGVLMRDQESINLRTILALVVSVLGVLVMSI